MLARRLRLEIAVLLLLFGGAAWLAGARDPLDLVSAAVACLLILIAVFVVASFAIAGTRSGLFESPASRLAEFAASVWTFLVLLPFGAGWLRRDPGRVDASPVLLVHGYVCNGAAFWRICRVLADAGFAPHTHDLEPVFAGIDEYVPRLAARIDEVLAMTGKKKVAVVCHSMGGLAMRAYLRAHGAGKVSLLVTLGTPHHGTRLAQLGIGANARQMEPDSPWLQALAGFEAGAPGVPSVSIYSEDDNVVTPQASARLAGAENVALSRVGHLSLLYSPVVFVHVLRGLRATAAL